MKNIPELLKEYYVRVYEFNKDKKSASYSMQKLSGVDLSVTFINGSIDSKDIANILNILKKYFLILKKLPIKKDQNSIGFITNKSNERHEQLKKWVGYKNLDNFINCHTIFSGIDDLYKSSNSLIAKKKRLLNNSGSYFSHGDLCFSNMIFSDIENKITFIDPRGGKDKEVFRTPYYDLAKISHSLLGGYDYIINNITMIEYDRDMKAYLNFNGAFDRDNEKLFKSFVESLGYDLNLIRAVEASLFISMLSLHIDDTRKVYMLALRASELLSKKVDLKKGSIQIHSTVTDLAKFERIYLNAHQSIGELTTDVDDYIEFYNHRRFHETLDYKKPMDVYQESVKFNQNKDS